MGRFAAAELKSERRILGLKLGGFFAFCAIMYLLWNLNLLSGAPAGDLEEMRYVGPRIIVGIALFFLLYFNQSGSFKRYFSRGKASAALMLPVSKAEKFTYAALLNLLVIPAVLIVFALANDAIWSGMLGVDSVCAWFGPILRRTIQEQPVSQWFGIGYGLSFFSGLVSFFLGGIFFRRHQFLLTWVAQFVLSIPMFMILNVINMQNIRSFSDSWMLDDELGVWMLVWSVVWIVGLMWWAWRRFANLQITK